MSLSILLFTILALGAYSFLFARQRLHILRRTTPDKQHSQNIYHGWFLFSCIMLPSLGLVILWLIFSPLLTDFLLENFITSQTTPPTQTLPLALLVAQVKAHYAGTLSNPTPAIIEASHYYKTLLMNAQLALTALSLSIAGVGFFYGAKHLAVRFAARQKVELILSFLVMVAACIAVLTTLGIILSLVFEAVRFFQQVPLTEFLFGLQWSPQTAIRTDQIGSSGSFGAVPIFAGTLLITLIAMFVAVPVGLMSAIYLSEYARLTTRNIIKPLIEVLAGIPTVVYGFFAALIVAPFLRDSGGAIGLTLSSESALAAGLVMGVMIIPFISSLSDDVISAVPQTLRDGAAALGATKSETVRQVILPAAMPGVVSAILLAISRAIGETMIVVMAAGVAANLTANPFEAVTTVTVQIVMLLVGDQEFDSAKTLAAFALGLVLFIMTLVLNIVALYVVNKYRRHYE